MQVRGAASLLDKIVTCMGSLAQTTTVRRAAARGLAFATKGRAAAARAIFPGNALVDKCKPQAEGSRRGHTACRAAL